MLSQREAEVRSSVHRGGDAAVSSTGVAAAAARGQGGIQVKSPGGRVFYAVAEWEHATLAPVSTRPAGCHHGPAVGRRQQQLLLHQSPTFWILWVRVYVRIKCSPEEEEVYELHQLSVTRYCLYTQSFFGDADTDAQFSS